MDFLNVFEITRRRIENFEPGAKKLNQADGYIHLL